MTHLQNRILHKALPFCLCLWAAFAFPGAAMASPEEDRISIASANALNDEDMSENRGGSTTSNTNMITVSSSQTMHASSAGNTVNAGGDMVNGHISVGDNFGASGIGSYVMNTGNNATINSGVSLSVLMLQ